MFETALVHSHAVDRRFSWLSFSLAVHTAAIAAVLVASIASTSLPTQAPKLMIPYLASVAPPPALGTPNPTPAPPRARASEAPRMALLPRPVSAPTIIPSTIPVTVDQPNPGPAAAASTDAGPEIGDHGPATIAANVAGPLPIGNGVKSPVVIRRVEPIYPQALVRARMSGSVVVQCIIDKSGRIRDVRVVTSTFSAFEQPAIDAVQQWLFAPGTLRGQPVDTIFELTVKFQVK